MQFAGLSTNNQKLGEFSLNVQNGIKTLIFTPTDPFETDLDIKIIKDIFKLGRIGTHTVDQLIWSIRMFLVLVV